MERLKLTLHRLDIRKIYLKFQKFNMFYDETFKDRSEKMQLVNHVVERC